VRYLSLILSCFLIVACQTTDPYTGEQKTSRTAKGAGIGAIAGAVIGAATSSSDDRKKGALTGAVVGGAVGGGIGYYQDQQEAALRQRLQATGVQVQREGNTIRLIMPGDITFDTGSYAIKPDFFPVLQSVSLVLQEYDKTVIRVNGHTDSTGGASLNQTLSEQRANSVGQYLGQQNIALGRIQTAGYGPRYPVATNETAEGRQANRRVELELVPL
jgi:outer membrane protein OmpA-like peptidoglycan-associated protein